MYTSAHILYKYIYTYIHVGGFTYAPLCVTLHLFYNLLLCQNKSKMCAENYGRVEDLIATTVFLNTVINVHKEKSHN